MSPMCLKRMEPHRHIEHKGEKTQKQSDVPYVPMWFKKEEIRWN